MWTTFEGVIVARTPAAIRFQGIYWEGPLWFPLSQVIIEEDNPETSHYVVKVKDWLPKKKGLLEFTHYGKEEIEGMDLQ